MTPTPNLVARVATTPAAGRVEPIQWLRGIAAMLVVCNHCLLLVYKYSGVPEDAAHQLQRNMALAGAFGVDRFFVISGFVMAMSAQRFGGAAGASVFLAQRYNRIAPLFYLVSVVMLIDLLRAQVPFDFRELTNTLTFVPWLDWREYHWPVHFLGWTLAFEFVFYGVVAVFIWRRWTERLVWLFAALLVAAVIGAVTDLPWMPLRMLTSALMLEFGAGVLLYLAWRAGWFQHHKPLWYALLAAALAAYGWPVASASPIVQSIVTGAFDGDAAGFRLLYWGLPALGIAAFMLTLRPGHDSRLRKIARAIGDASYSIYLTHLFVVRLAEETIQRFDIAPWPAAAVAFLVSPLVGWLCYRLVEQPLLRWGQRLLSRYRRPARVPVRTLPAAGADRLADRSL